MKWEQKTQQRRAGLRKKYSRDRGKLTVETWHSYEVANKGKKQVKQTNKPLQRYQRRHSGSSSHCSLRFHYWSLHFWTDWRDRRTDVMSLFGKHIDLPFSSKRIGVGFQYCFENVHAMVRDIDKRSSLLGCCATVSFLVFCCVEYFCNLYYENEPSKNISF